MKSSWQVGIVVLTLAGLSGCAGVQQRGRSSSPLEGLSADAPGRPGWPTSRLFPWRAASAEPRVETVRRTARPSAPETDIWPNRGGGVLSRLLTAFPSSRSRATGGGSSILSRRESSSTAKLTAAEANEAIARLARPRPGSVPGSSPASAPATRDAAVLTTRGEAPADDRTAISDLDAPPLLSTPIALPDIQGSGARDPDAVRTQAPPPPPLRPTPRPVESSPEPEPEPEPQPQPQPQPAEIHPPAEPKPEPEPEPVEVKPAPEVGPAEIAPPSEPAKSVESKPAPEAKPADVAPAAEPVKPVESPAPAAAPAPVGEPPAPIWETQYAPTVAPAPQIQFAPPELAMAAPASAPTHHHAAPRKWSFWNWKKPNGRAAGSPIAASAQLPAVQFPASYGSIAAQPLTPCPDHARVVTPTAQHQVVFPSAQTVAAPPAEKCARLKALGACLHDKLERVRAWKHEHICKHLQNFKAALFGDRCPTCLGHPGRGAGPLASPQAPPVLASSQFGLY